MSVAIPSFRTLILYFMCMVGAVSALAQSQTYDVTGVASDDTLNVRERPSSRSRIVTRLAPNATNIAATGETKQNGRSLWRRIRVGASAGWVNTRFLKARVKTAASAGTTNPPSLATSENVAAKLKKRVALVIGNSGYTGSVTPLANASNDARDIGVTLKSLGFEVLEAIDADLAASRRALKRFKRQARGAEIALFFFAGHGAQIRSENYLIPTSGEFEEPEDLAQGAVSLSEIMNVFQEAKPSLSIIVLDACRNNPTIDIIEQNARSRGLRGLNIRKGLARRSGLPGMMIVYSTAPDNVASDGTGRNSPFSQALIEKAREPEVEVRLMFGAVRDAVVKATAGRQTPWVEEAVLGRYFFKPAPVIRKSLFFGKWLQESWTLHVDAESAQIVYPSFVGRKPVELTKQACGDVYERSYANLRIDRIRRDLGNARIEKWARRATTDKTVRVMKIVCAYRANRYYFLLADKRQMLVTRFSEQDWLMHESVDKAPE